MKFFEKYRKELLLLLAIIGIYFLLRVPNLTLQPIFADEAIYIRWAQVMRAESTLRFLPLSDGKTPLFMWTLMPTLKLIEDPLFAGRFLSVMSGLATLLGVFALSWKVFSIRVALWASLIYAVVPYTVFFDRMALVDSMLSAFTIWVVFFAVWLARSPRLDLAMILGFILGGAWLTKTPAFLNLLILPVSILAFSKKQKLFKLLLFWTVAAAIALFMYNLLRLGPSFHLVSSRNADYVFSFAELAGRPLDPFIPHFNDISDWFPKLLTWPILGSMIYGVWLVVKSKNRVALVVLLWALAPLLISMAFLKTFTARYLLPPIPLLLIFAAYGFDKIFNFQFTIFKKNLVLKTLVMLLVLLPMALKFDYELLTSPPPTSLPKAERLGYFEMWTAGYGLKDIAGLLIDAKEEGSVVVGTEGFFGTLPDGLYIYLDKSKISVVGSHASISAQIKDAAKTHKTFFVGNKSSLESIFPVAWLIREYPKAKPLDGTKGDATVLYQVLP